MELEYEQCRYEGLEVVWAGMDLGDFRKSQQLDQYNFDCGDKCVIMNRYKSFPLFILLNTYSKRSKLTSIEVLLWRFDVEICLKVSNKM